MLLPVVPVVDDVKVSTMPGVQAKKSPLAVFAAMNVPP